MDLDEIDRMIAERNARIEKRKQDGTLFEDEVGKNKAENEDERLQEEVNSRKQQMADQLKQKMPPCPQCGQKMTFIPEESLVACESCGIGMRVPT